MTPNQLGNVLFKVLGVSVCVQALHSTISALVIVLINQPTFNLVARTGTYFAGAAIEVIAGIVLIAFSQAISDWLLKRNE